MLGLGTLSLDVRYALRSLRRAPVFTAVVLATLVAGVAAVTTIFSYLNAIYFVELPYHDADRIVNVAERQFGPLARPSSAHAVQLLRQRTASFDRVSVWEFAASPVLLGDTPRQIQVLAVDTSFVPLFALRPAAGRLIRAEEILGNAPVAMISSTLWEAYYGGDTAAIGRFITLSDREHQIVGVLPRGFRYPHQTDAIVPLDENALSTRAGVARTSQDQEYIILARLRPGITRETARAEIAVLDRRLPKARGSGRLTDRLMVHDEMLDRRARQYLPLPGLVLGTGLFVLLIACANVANLFLARGAERRAEIAIRAALGAGRWRLIRQTLTETLLLGGIAAAAGTLMSPLLVKLGLSFIPTHGFPSWFRVETDYRVTLFALGVLLLVTLAVGLSPALEGTRFDVSAALKVGGEGSGVTGRVMRSSSRGLVVQLALGVCLLVCSVLLVRSHFRIASVDVGYPAERIANVQPFFDRMRYPDLERRAAFLEEIAGELRGSAAAGTVALHGVFGGFRDATGKNASDQSERRYDPRLIPDRDSTRALPSRPPGPRQHVASDEYFDVMALRIREGRGFTSEDKAGGMPVSVISASAAKALWPTSSAVGHTIQVGAQGEQSTIVGVVDDVFDLYGGRRGMTNDPVAALYYSSRQGVAGQAHLLARGPGDVRAIRSFIVSRLHEADPMLVIGPGETLASNIEEHLMVTRVFGGLIGAFAFVALALSVIGTYGVVAFGVARRRREIGIRMALGGTHSEIVRHVMSGTLRFVGVGMVLGIGLGYLLGRVLRVFLFGVTASDPTTYAVVCAIFAAVAALACWLPARRAAKVDPLVALRAE